MKHAFIIFFLFLSAFIYSQNEVINKSNTLINEKQYKSAFLVLDEADPQNKVPSLAISKTNLVLDYYVSSIMHQVFALADLQPDQELPELRAKKGNYDMFIFAPDTILSELIRQNPDNYMLQKTLGRYYHEVHLKYGSDWIIPDSMLVLKFMTHYGKAYEKGVYDARSLYGLGYGFLLFKNYKQSIPFFIESIQVDSTDPAAYYNLAYAYLFNEEKEKALASAFKAINLYEYAPYKAEAARLAAVTFAEMNNVEKSLELYRYANQINPNDYNTLRPLLAMEVQLGDTSFRRTAGNFLALAPANPTIYQDLMHIFWRNGKQDILIDFLDKAKPVFVKDTAVSANLYFFIGKIYFDKGDTTHALQNFKQARHLFDDVYQPDHAVFGVIDDYMKLED